MKSRTVLTALVMALAGLLAHAQEFKAGSVTVSQPYARATGAGQAVGGGFMKIDNRGADDRLVSASAASVARSVELHSMKMEGDVMRMRQVEAIELKSGQTVSLQPGGYHVMFMGLKAPLKAGDSFPVVLKFEKAGEVTVNVKVEGAPK